jgi:hypothetical protein
MTRLDPRVSFLGRDVRPRTPAGGDRQAGHRWPEREHGRAAVQPFEHVRYRVGELPSVAARGGDLLNEVKQVVCGLAVLQAAEQDQVTVPGQNAVPRNGEKPGGVSAGTMADTFVIAQTSLPP